MKGVIARVLKARDKAWRIVVWVVIRGSRVGVGPLNGIGCGEGLLVLGHYHPPCPQPELTIGTQKHADHDFLTVLLQDQISGFKVLHRGHWVDVPPSLRALVVNIGDLLQAR